MSMTPSNVLNNLNQVANDVMVIYIPEVLMTIRTFSQELRSIWGRRSKGDNKNTQVTLDSICLYNHYETRTDKEVFLT